jgi:hypothetical protein
MSVFSLDAVKGNPVTSETVDKLCSQLGVSIEASEKEAYTRLLAVFHDSSEQLMAMDGRTVLRRHASISIDGETQIMFRQSTRNTFPEKMFIFQESLKTRTAPGHGSAES